MTTKAKTANSNAKPALSKRVKKLCRDLVNTVKEFNGIGIAKEQIRQLGRIPDGQLADVHPIMCHAIDGLMNDECNLGMAYSEAKAVAYNLHQELLEHLGRRSYLDAIQQAEALSVDTLMQVQRTVGSPFLLNAESVVDVQLEMECIEPDEFEEDIRLNVNHLVVPLSFPKGTGPLNTEQMSDLYVQSINSLTTNLMPPAMLDDVLAYRNIKKAFASDWISKAKLNCEYGGLFWAARRYLVSHDLPVQETVQWFVDQGAVCDLDVVALLCRGNDKFRNAHWHY